MERDIYLHKSYKGLCNYSIVSNELLVEVAKAKERLYTSYYTWGLPFTYD
jgi:hypothetical protein